MRTSDAFLAALLRILPDPVLSLDDDGQVLSLNPAAERLVGRPPLAMIDSPVLELLSPEEPAALERALARSFDETTRAEIVMRPRHGRRAVVELTLTPVDAAGQRVRALVLHDVTEEREREESLRRNQARLRQLAHALAAAAELDDVGGLITDTAVETTHAFGACLERMVSPERDVEIVAASGHGVPPVGTRVPYPGSLTQTITLGANALVVPLISAETALGALVLVRNAGQRQFEEEETARATILGDLAAVVFRRALLVQSERAARTEAERRASEEEALQKATGAVAAPFTIGEMVRQIAQSALAATNADGSLVERVDADLKEVETVAVAGRPTLALGARVKYGGSITELVIERGGPEVIPRLTAAGGRISPDLLRSCPHCAALAVPLVDAGEAIGALVLVRTAEKEPFSPAEVEHARTFAGLAALAFRKVQLLEETERRRVELADVMESRARLVRGFSHDVKNPLGAADGYLALMEEGIPNHLSDAHRESVSRARRSIGTALGLIEDLTALARAEAGRIDVKRQPVDVCDIVREIADEYRARAETDGLSMVVDAPDEFPALESDAARVRQILGNLLSNAIKYTDDGGITVRVALRDDARAPRAGRWVAVDVRDTGRGIPVEQQKLVFQEFRRLENAGETTGAGIGLAISQRIARALDGEITVESQAGRGSTFTLWLPLGAA